MSCSIQGPSINCLGPGKRLFTGDFPAVIRPEKFMFMLFFSSEYHSNGNYCQTNFPELVDGNGRNDLHPRNSFDIKSVIQTGAQQLISTDIQKPLSVTLLELPIQKLEEFEVSSGKNDLRPKKSPIRLRRSLYMWLEWYLALHWITSYYIQGYMQKRSYYITLPYLTLHCITLHYIHTHIHLHAHTYMCMYVIMCVYVCMHVCSYLCMYVCMYAHTLIGRQCLVKNVTFPQSYSKNTQILKPPFGWLQIMCRCFLVFSPLPSFALVFLFCSASCYISKSLKIAQQLRCAAIWHIYIYIYIYTQRVLTWIRNQTRAFTWLRHHFYYKLAISFWGRNTYFGNVFKEFGVCCWNLCFLFYAIILHTFQDFEPAIFKPIFFEMFKVFPLKHVSL